MRSTRRACARSSPAASRRALDFFVDAVAHRARPCGVRRGHWGAVASLSPELFLRRARRVGDVEPIKGTLPRIASPGAARFGQDVAENVMIVDLVRNDLGRVAITGSVTVPDCWWSGRRPACGIWCRRSRRGPTLRSDGRRARRDFPPASVTGSPKA